MELTFGIVFDIEIKFDIEKELNAGIEFGMEN